MIKQMTKQKIHGAYNKEAVNVSRCPKTGRNYLQHIQTVIRAGAMPGTMTFREKLVSQCTPTTTAVV